MSKTLLSWRQWVDLFPWLVAKSKVISESEDNISTYMPNIEGPKKVVSWKANTTHNHQWQAFDSRTLRTQQMVPIWNLEGIALVHHRKVSVMWLYLLSWIHAEEQICPLSAFRTVRSWPLCECSFSYWSVFLFGYETAFKGLLIIYLEYVPNPRLHVCKDHNTTDL